MNERLRESLLRSEVKKLSEEQRSLYQFVVEIENCLAQSAETVVHFLRLLVKYSPYELASRHFDLLIKKVVRLMNDIEVELNKKVEIRCARSKWIDLQIACGNRMPEKEKKGFFSLLT